MEKEVIKNHLQQIRESLGLTQEQFGAPLGISRHDVSRYEKGQHLTVRKIIEIGSYYGFTFDELINGTQTGVPIFGKVEAGPWTEINRLEKPEQYLLYSSRKKNKTLIALCATGDSMNRWAANGQYVIVDTSSKNPADLDGKPVIARRGHEGTFKIFRRDPNRLEPYSNVPDYQTLYIDQEWEIVGEVIDAVRNPQIIEKEGIKQ